MAELWLILNLYVYIQGGGQMKSAPPWKNTRGCLPLPENFRGGHAPPCCPPLTKFAPFAPHFRLAPLSTRPTFDSPHFRLAPLSTQTRESKVGRVRVKSEAGLKWGESESKVGRVKSGASRKWGDPKVGRPESGATRKWGDPKVGRPGVGRLRVG